MIGKEILNYRIISLIGHGGMGDVYLAEHVLIQNEKVAIKIIKSEMVNDFTRKLLRDEAEHLAGLNHNNIVSFKNYHIDSNNNIYLIMEYADGRDLESYIKNVSGLIVEEKIGPMFEPLLDAVGYAHKKKVLHRDIKPANVVINSEGVPKILDFGIAQIIKNQEEDTETGIVMGTPAYMSPEQVRGEHLDERSDIYSLGVLLHHMLTGRAPYDTTTMTEAQINSKVVNEPLPPMRTYYKYVSEKLQKVVDRATAKNPADRYQTCDEFKKDLHRILYPSKLPNWAKYAAAGVLTLVLGGSLYAWDYNRVKVRYYKDYTEQWGVPQGIGKLSSREHSHASRAYKFVYQKHKLIQVQHVNSLDYVINDGESERNERPIDQSFTYTTSGDVSRVTVRDRSGKVLYVKSYNDKLNTMSFQYDDEHGTEMVLSNQSAGQNSLVEQNPNERGRISRWWIEYDEDGYATTIKYAGLDNTPVGDDNGIFGRKYIYDGDGRVTEIQYIGLDGQPQSTKWGLGKKRYYYDGDDNWQKVVYLTVDDKPAYSAADGCATCTWEYDKYGNVIKENYLDGDNKVMIPKASGAAGYNHQYNDNGQCIRIESLDIDGKPMFERGSGYAIQTIEYDVHGYVNKVTYNDTDGNPTENSSGISYISTVNDDHGNFLEQWFYKRNGKLSDAVDGIAGYKAEYDSVGNKIKTINYGLDKKPCEDGDGAYGRLFEYNERHQQVKMTNLGADLKPAADDNGIVIAKFTYDVRGNISSISLYEADGKTRRLHKNGWAGVNNVYDNDGKIIEHSFFGVDGNPTLPAGIHYAKEKYTYDKNGNMASYRYYNLSDNLVEVDGIAGRDYVNDKRGNTLEDKPIGANGQLASRELIAKYKYDQYDNRTEMALFNANGPVANYEGIHRYAYTYNSRNQRINETYYNTSGQLTLGEKKYAIVKNEYDKKGNRVKASYFGTDQRPCKTADGYSSVTWEYDQFGNIVKQCHFCIDGKPTDPSDTTPVYIAKYDNRGNQIYVASQDGHGKFMNFKGEKWAINKIEYDNKGNKTSDSYFDAQEQPASCNDGYHKVSYKYDKQGNEIEESYYGTNQQPTTVNGYHRETYKYAENSSNIVELAMFGINGQPVNCAGGWHKCIVSYNDEGTVATYRKFYTTSGTLRVTLRRNGNDWIPV